MTHNFSRVSSTVWNKTNFPSFDQSSGHFHASERKNTSSGVPPLAAVRYKFPGLPPPSSSRFEVNRIFRESGDHMGLYSHEGLNVIRDVEPRSRSATHTEPTFICASMSSSATCFSSGES